MSIHIFGIRHHGPGSARSLRQALEALQPDTILVEGPPEADPVLPLLIHPEMQPPVALLVYPPDQPQQAIYYPLAVYSPEWQALHYGLTHDRPVQFMDLPQTHRFGLRAAAEAQPTDTPDAETCTESSAPEAPPEEKTDPPVPDPQQVELQRDPLGWLAEAAGYCDRELWWEHMVEQRQDSRDLFAAILEVMTALRAEADQHFLPEDPATQLEAYREAHMRQTIRAAQKQGYDKIAVVCGAWHAPALVELPPAKTDAALLKGLPKTKVQATWVPWTYGRLTWSSGYGAGVDSPAWYDHLWHWPEQVGQRWLVRVARLLREQDLDASSASVIEAVRLAESLAALRDRPRPGLLEFTEAVQTVLCFGDDLPMQLIHQKLIVGERLGAVPEATPMIPLQQDLLQHQKRLRLKPEATAKLLELDLRKPTDLERSQLLHRLRLLNLPWGEPQQARGKGTFKEIWRLQWQPEFAVSLIEAGVWGNTVATATTAYALDQAQQADLPLLTQLLDQVLLADLPPAIAGLMTRLQAEAAIASDIAHLMGALPSLAQILRYGNVRQTDTESIAAVVKGLLERICIGLPLACASLDDDAASQLDGLILGVNQAVMLLQQPEQLQAWQTVLQQISDRQEVHGLITGHCCRLLLDAAALTPEAVARRMGLALSVATEPTAAGAWIEGFLKGSGLLLLHDQQLWQVLDQWVAGLTPDTFTTLLPLLRRTFANFSAAERRQMGEQVRSGGPSPGTQAQATTEDFDLARADQVLAIAAQLLGLPVQRSL